MFVYNFEETRDPHQRPTFSSTTDKHPILNVHEDCRETCTPITLRLGLDLFSRHIHDSLRPERGLSVA